MGANTVILARDSITPTLGAVDDEGLGLLSRINPGARVAVTILSDGDRRSVDQQRWFWMFLAEVAKASKYENAEKLMVALKLALGRFDWMALANGKRVPYPHSTSFRTMGHKAFTEFVADCKRLIDETILAEASDAERARIYAILDGGSADRTVT